MKLIAFILGLVVTIGVTQNSLAQIQQSPTVLFKINKKMLNYDATTFDSWLDQQVITSEKKLLEAMSYQDTARGAVIASPSKEKPDYYFHWVRDAGLVMDVVVDLYKKSKDANYRLYLNQKLRDYVNFSISNQKSQALTGLGEPKFYVDGTPYGLPWGRPQNDGPALRAMTLIKWAHVKIAEGDINYVKNVLYDGNYPSSTVIKADLEFVARHWRDANFDLWEEVSGDHFFTRMTQRASLLQGAELAQKLGDFGASDWYLREAHKITSSLKAFTHSKKTSYIPATLNNAGGMDTKKSNIDIAVILGILRGENRDGFIKWTDSKVQNTLGTIVDSFKGLYPINKMPNVPGVAIGRYPEDVYDGDGFQGGNPWVLTTLAVAEAYYEMAALEAASSTNKPDHKVVAESLIDIGDNYFKRVQIHANPDGSLAEQISRFNGYMTSARDLTWSYASVITANWSRERALQAIK